MLTSGNVDSLPSLTTDVNPYFGKLFGSGGWLTEEGVYDKVKAVSYL